MIQISDQLNGIIKYAREEAMRTGSYGIGPDHLFLGIIRHEENTAFQVLQGLGVEPAELKSFIDGRIFTNETIPYSEIDHINFSRQAQNVLSITVMEATRLKSPEAAPITSCSPYAARRTATARPSSAAAAWTTAGCSRSWRPRAC